MFFYINNLFNLPLKNLPSPLFVKEGYYATTPWQRGGEAPPFIKGEQREI
jgi:hypothetical protein